MLRKPFNLLKRAFKAIKNAISYRSGKARAAGPQRRKNASPTARTESVRDYLDRHYSQGGGMGSASHPVRAYGEALQRRYRSGSKYAKPSCTSH